MNSTDMLAALVRDQREEKDRAASLEAMSELGVLRRKWAYRVYWRACSDQNHVQLHM